MCVSIFIKASTIQLFSLLNKFKMDFDQILVDFGEYGSYQKKLIWLIVLPCVLPCGFHAYNQLFMASSPKHWCKEE